MATPPPPSLSAADADLLRELRQAGRAARWTGAGHERMPFVYLPGARATVHYAVDVRYTPPRHRLVAVCQVGDNPRPLVEAILDLWMCLPLSAAMAGYAEQPALTYIGGTTWIQTDTNAPRQAAPRPEAVPCEP